MIRNTPSQLPDSKKVDQPQCYERKFSYISGEILAEILDLPKGSFITDLDKDKDTGIFKVYFFHPSDKQTLEGVEAEHHAIVISQKETQ